MTLILYSSYNIKGINDTFDIKDISFNTFDINDINVIPANKTLPGDLSFTLPNPNSNLQLDERIMEDISDFLSQYERYAPHACVAWNKREAFFAFYVAKINKIYGIIQYPYSEKSREKSKIF